ncbi:MAG: glycosyltransferase family 4 protein [Actinomycetota bacterium]|nr:glycosyltransferase family 4 protein [Actinomycetota bacterium]
MRIGLVCPYSLTIPGGVQGQVLGLARELRRHGHEARVLGPCDGPPPDAGVTPLGRSVPTAANGSVAPLAPDPSAQLRTIRALRDEAFDVVHLHEPCAPGPALTAMMTETAPLVGTFHAAGTSAPYRYLGWGLKRMTRRLAHRVAVSPDAMALAQTHLGGTYELLFNGIEVERFCAVEPHPTLGPTVFFLGRHEPRKGLDVLLAATRDLPADVTVWVGGDGPQSAELQARYGHDPRIEWLGRISDHERAARMRACTVYCSPSVRGESFGMVLLEAMAAGCALVASDLDGHRNVATDGLDALLAPVGDAQALAKSLNRVLEDPGLRAELVAGGRRRAEQLSMSRLAERYLEIYDEVRSAGRPTRPWRRSRA